jgi:hypothetical protein
MKSMVAQVGADFNTSKLQATATPRWPKEGLFSEVTPRSRQ